MAYTFFPKTATEIQTTLKSDNKNKVSDIIQVFAYLRKLYKKVETPINIDPKSISKINVTRDLQGTVDLKKIITATKIKNITLKFGSGSAGNRGVANRGNLFEPTFADAIRKYYAGEKIQDKAILDAVLDLDKTYGITSLKNFQVQEVGELNNKRPLKFSPSIVISSVLPVTGNDIGPIVTDLTLKSGKNDIAYLSLKLGNTVTFFNVGIKTILTSAEIKSGTITNRDGLKLLNLFNIKPALFCDIFNGKMKKGYSENVWSNMKPAQKTALQTLLESGIGHGYHVIHKLNQSIKSFKVTPQYMKTAATPTSCVIHYGGKTGTGKRIDMEITTATYILKLNIRDTQGGDGYPTRMMCDFTYA
jgi:hypothetical protein